MGMCIEVEGKTISDFYTEGVSWSEFEDREPEEIFKSIK